MNAVTAPRCIPPPPRVPYLSSPLSPPSPTAWCRTPLFFAALPRPLYPLLFTVPRSYIISRIIAWSNSYLSDLPAVHNVWFPSLFSNRQNYFLSSSIRLLFLSDLFFHLFHARLPLLSIFKINSYFASFSYHYTVHNIILHKFILRSCGLPIDQIVFSSYFYIERF